MNKLIRGAALTIAAITVMTTTALAASVPVRETFEQQGFSVTWDQATKTVTLSKDGYTVSEQIGENITLDYDTTYATEEFVNTVLSDYTREMLSTKATVKELGAGYILADTEKLGEVIFMVDENTHYHHEMNRMLYTFADLQKGSSIKVYFSEAMTASLPPQVYATEVVFLNTEAVTEEKKTTEALTMTGTVISAGEGHVLVNTEKMGEVMFMVDENTNIHHEMNRMFYALADLTEGMSVTVNHAEAMTASLPPQVYATEIIIMNTEEKVDTTLETEGKIVAIGEDFFTVEKEDGSRVRFNVGEETHLHHVMNRMLYRFESLEEGMSVTVKHSDAMTYSLPPQTAAIEVIIK